MTIKLEVDVNIYWELYEGRVWLNFKYSKWIVQTSGAVDVQVCCKTCCGKKTGRNLVRIAKLYEWLLNCLQQSEYHAKTEMTHINSYNRFHY